MDESKLSPLEKILVPYIKVVGKGAARLIEFADDKFDAVEKYTNWDVKNKEFQKNHPVLNAGKQFAKGCIMGTIKVAIGKHDSKY
ncbi:hypothetical protein ACJDU8_24575 [Clostridium sp. WILCCON 0269]|uniref:Uncharacterized protein n=1 Tax=Candidatus Clostridium eludens TaxID=3381663 RepID=A0ABW8SSD8_9CLOT